MEETVAKMETIASSSIAERLFAGGGATGMLVGAGAVAYFDPTTAGFFPVCPLYSMTGFACPGCGLTRGFHALFHGDVLGALDYNALLPGFVLLLGFLFISMVLIAVRGRGLSVRLIKPNYMWIFLVLLGVFGVARNIPVYPFSILFP
jgi:hypothetical protein